MLASHLLSGLDNLLLHTVKRGSGQFAHFIHEEELLSQERGDVQELSLNNVIIVDSFHSRVNNTKFGNVETDWGLLLLEGVSKQNDSFLGIEGRVLSQSFWDNQKGFSKSLDTELCFGFNGILEFLKSFSCSNLESSSTRNDESIVNYVLDSSKTISNSILDIDFLIKY